jgi:glucose/arabinose dehydrogenase
LDIVFPANTDLRYVATQPGNVLLFDNDGYRAQTVLDLTNDVVTGGEKGLLGLALHPRFGANNRLFVRYSAQSRPGTPDHFDHTEVLSEFAVSSDRTSAKPQSERTIMEIPQPQGNHNAGDVRFGPDGLLYVPMGDGGGGNDRGRGDNDGHPEDWYDANPGGNGQDTQTYLLGGVLRIDVDASPTEHYRTDQEAPESPTGDGGYAIPEDNPLVDTPGHRDEYYAWGLRNPWRASFDAGRYFVGDVGQGTWEEINLVEKGGNYGWNVREGFLCFPRVNDECPNSAPAAVRGEEEPLQDPIIQYTHGEHEPGDRAYFEEAANELGGVSVIGGYVYRGDEIPGLSGRYVFGDLRSDRHLYVGTPPDEQEHYWPTTRVPLVDSAAEHFSGLRSFGRDRAGEIYVLDENSVYRLTASG